MFWLSETMDGGEGETRTQCVAEFFVKCRLQHRIKILNIKRIQFRRDIRSLKQIGQFQN